jgi:hypothetical protein
MDVDQEGPGRNDAALDLFPPAAAELDCPAAPEGTHDRQYRRACGKAAGRDRDRVAREREREQEAAARLEGASVTSRGDRRMLELAVEKLSGQGSGV